MISTFAIALREGLEASLIIGILVAYLVKTDRRERLRALWIGVAAAIALSLTLGAFLSYTSAELSHEGEMVFAGTTALVAVGLVTWMIFWMRRTARGLKAELEGKADQAILTGSVALAVAAFAAVAREGLETALFLYTNFKTVGAFSGPTIGLVLGLVTAVALGYGIYSSAIRINLSKFFTYSGVALIVVAAGVLAHGVGEFLELGWIPGGAEYAWNITTISESSLIPTILNGTIGFSTSITWVQLAIWAAYIALSVSSYLAPVKSVKTPQNA